MRSVWDRVGEAGGAEAMASGSLFRLFFNFGYKGSSANDKSLLEMDLAEMVLVETDLEPTETASP